LNELVATAWDTWIDINDMPQRIQLNSIVFLTAFIAVTASLGGMPILTQRDSWQNALRQ